MTPPETDNRGLPASYLTELAGDCMWRMSILLCIAVHATMGTFRLAAGTPALAVIVAIPASIIWLKAWREFREARAYFQAAEAASA